MKVSTIGVLKAGQDGENRVPLVPDTARRLVRQGLEVVVEAGAGVGAWYPDEAYIEAGARTAAFEELVAAAQVLVSLDRPAPQRLGRLKSGQALVGLLGGPGDGELTELAGRGVVVVSLETLPRTLSRAQSMDVLTSQASVAGYKAVLVAAGAFGRYFPLLITAAGTSRPARVLVLGAGVAGLSAIGTARRLGAVVTGYDVRPETKGEVQSLGAKFLELTSVASGSGSGGYARVLTPEEQEAQQAELESHLAAFDVVITTAAVPGRRPPLLIRSPALDAMRPGSVIVDMASGALGGNVETSVPDTSVTTPGGVTVIGASNLPSTVPTAASDAFSQNIGSVLGVLVRDGELALDPDDEVIRAVVVAAPTESVEATVPGVNQ